jgi:hypothetical protein
MIQQPPSRAKNASGLCVPDVAKARMSALDVRWHSSTPISSRGTMRATQWLILTVLGAAGALTLSCSKQNSSSGAVAKDTSGAAPASASTTSSASPDSILRGTVKDVSDSVLTISSPSGEVRVALMQPLKVYAREPGNLSRVTDRTFVGVTSVSQPDGSQRATEIHVFPEELRGLGEGSRPMGQPSGGSRSTMTNGSVANSRMTNGAARMTNGTAHGTAGGTITVEYNGGSQTITVPANVPVTVIAPTNTKLSSGTSVIVAAKKQSNGQLGASMVMLAPGR